MPTFFSAREVYLRKKDVCESGNSPYVMILLVPAVIIGASTVPKGLTFKC